MASGPQWTIRSFKRTCNSADTSCGYVYGIDTHAAPVTQCSYTVTGNPAAGNPTSRASYNNVKCGSYTISSNWSGQFGPCNGFQTLAITNGKVIVYPAYKDTELAGGKTVTPDKSYQPQNLP